MSNKKTADLMELMSLCLPDNQQLKRESILEEIKVMDAYQEMAHWKAVENVYQRYFAMEVLKKMDVDMLSRVKGIIPKALNCLNDIMLSIQNGAAPKLTPEDIPDFYDWDSVASLQSRLALGDSENYTNISQEDFMVIFSEDTVKSGEEIFGQMESSEKEFDRAIASIMRNQPYCISKKEIADLEVSYQENVNGIRGNEKPDMKGFGLRLTKKLACCILCFMIPALVASMTGMINIPMLDMSRAIIVIASIVLIIGG